MDTSIIEALEDLKEKKIVFSLHTLVKKYKIPEEVVKKNLKEILNYEDLNIFAFVYCTVCNKKIFDIEYDPEFYKKNLTCYKCKEKFKPSLEKSRFSFDFRTLKERFKAL